MLPDCFSLTDGARFGGSCLIHGPPLPPLPLHSECEDLSVSGDAGIEEVKSPVLRSSPAFSHSRCPPEVHRSCICVRFIAEHTKMLEDSTKVRPVEVSRETSFNKIFTRTILVFFLITDNKCTHIYFYIMQRISRFGNKA